jgi:hypothetical protein
MIGVAVAESLSLVIDVERLRGTRRDQALQVSFGDGVEGVSRSAIPVSL